jgi:RNA polymerase sigma-70 factor (ECF subfamily)
MWPSGLFKYETGKKLEIEEFHQIFLDLYPDLCLYALKFVNDIDTSKDIVQEVLTRFWMENEKLLNKSLIRPYLYKSVKNQSLKFKKKEKRKTGLDAFLDEFEEVLMDSENQNQINTISYKNLQNDLKEAVNEMPEQRKRIFQMSRFQNMKHKEIALELQISPKTVETQIYRSLTFLRKKLQHYLE